MSVINESTEPRMLTKCEPIRLIEGCPQLNIRGISVPLSGLMGRINKAAHSCATPMFSLAESVAAGAPALLRGRWLEINVFPLGAERIYRQAGSLGNIEGTQDIEGERREGDRVKRDRWGEREQVKLEVSWL